MFGGLADRVGGRRLTIELAAGATVGDLRAQLAADHPQLAEALPRTSVAVDLEVAGDDRSIGPDDEVALLPPVAGGAGDPDAPRVVTGLTEPPFDVDAVIDQISGPATGGTVVFLGTVRDHAPDLDTEVVGLEYSAYPQMAEKVLADVVGELLSEHPDLDGIALLHAVGDLEVGDHTILIACAAAHRQEAFTACSTALEEVKARIPVFKREVTADGTTRWVGLPDQPVEADS